VQGISQLKPSFQTYDAYLQAKKKEAEVEEEEVEAEEEEVKTVQVQIRKGESERAQTARKKSYAYLQQQREEEPWTNLEYFESAVRNLPSNYHHLTIFRERERRD
jgi:hypothetical protein